MHVVFLRCDEKCTRAYHKNIFFGEYLQSNSDKFNGYRFYTPLLLGLRKKNTRHH